MCGDKYVGMRLDGVSVSDNALTEEDTFFTYVVESERSTNEANKFYNSNKRLEDKKQ